MTTLVKKYDVVIIGAGMVGLACAHLLSDTGLRIAVCEANPHTDIWQADDYDFRVSALNKNTQQLFEQIDCWSALKALRISPYDTMQIWELTGDYQLTFSAAENHQDYLGYIVENSAIKTALLEHLPDTVELLCPIKFTCLESAEIMQLIAEDGAIITANLIIGADGANSWLRSAVDITIQTYAYQQQAMVATVKTEHAHHQTAYQYFLPTGPLAFLPLDNAYYSSIVWSADDALAKQLLALSKTEFADELTTIMQKHLGQVQIVSAIKNFPLQMRHANEYVKPGIALIGDALRTIHPLAGQGVNLGFKDAQVLTTIIKTAIAKNKNYANLSILKKYQRARKSETLAMIVAMEFFKQAFAKENLKSARKTVIEQINKYNFIKKFFANIASGI